MPMEKIEGGVWVCFAEGIENGALYKYCVTGADGRQILKSDPFAAYSQTGSETASIVWNGGDFRWGDGEYMQRRAKRDFMTQTMTGEFEEDQDAKAVMKEVLKACKKVEPDCEIFM